MSKEVQGPPPFRGVPETIEQSVQTEQQSLFDEDPNNSPLFVPVTGADIVKDTYTKEEPATEDSEEWVHVSGLSKRSENMKKPRSRVAASASEPLSVMPMGSRANLRPTSPDDVKQSCESSNYNPSSVARSKSSRKKPPTKNSYLVTEQDCRLDSMVKKRLDILFTDDFLQENQEILEQFIKQPSTKYRKCYYIPLEFLLRHRIFRTILHDPGLLRNVIFKFKSYHLTENNYVGKRGYVPFPIRELRSHHTIIVGGIVRTAQAAHLMEVLRAFGNVRKIVFDFGVQSVDREVMLKLANKTEFVHSLRTQNGTNQLLFGIDSNAPHWVQFRCVGMICQGQTYKKVRNGYFCDNLEKPSMQICLPCAGERAKAMIEHYQYILNISDFKDKAFSADYFAKHCFGQGMIHCCGTQFYAENYKSAIVVFDSHKQASQCLFVLRRLSICGLFATHYHEYQLLKQEVLEESLRDM